MTQSASKETNKHSKGKMILAGVLGVAFIVVLLLPEKKNDPPPPTAGAKRRRPPVRRGASVQQAQAGVAGPTKSVRPLPRVRLQDVIDHNPFEADGKSAVTRHSVPPAKMVQKPRSTIPQRPKATPHPWRNELAGKKVGLVLRTKQGVTIVSGNKIIHLGRDEANGVILHKVDEQGADVEFLPRKTPAASEARK